MTTYKELLAQRNVLEAQIAEARKTELADAITAVRGIVEEFGLTESDVFSAASKKSGPRAGGTVAAKYRDPATGATWTGRGKAPRWIAGQDRSQFAI